MQVFHQPIVIESWRAGEVRHSRKNDQTEAVAGPFADKILEDRRSDVETGDPFARRAHVQRHHRPGQIEHQHDIHAAGLRLGVIVGKTQPGQRDDTESDGQQSQKQQQTPSRCFGRRPCRSRDIRARKTQS